MKKNFFDVDKISQLSEAMIDFSKSGYEYIIYDDNNKLQVSMNIPQFNNTLS